MDAGHFYMRDSKLVAVTGADCVLLVHASGSFIHRRTARPGQWSLLIRRLVEPLRGAELLDLAASVPELDEALVDELVADGYLRESPDEPAPLALRECMFHDNQGLHLVPGEPRCGHLLLACTGSVVSGLMPATILSLVHSGFQRQLDVILTESAQRFLNRDLLASYGVRTWSDPFERKDGIHVPHVQLARSADCLLVLPATADCLHRLAVGASSDLLSMTATAIRSPIVVSPAMNDAMWENRAVQRNVARLRDDGVYVIEPTLIFGAADFASGGGAMYGGHGTLWAGPGALLSSLAAVPASDSRGRVGG